MDIGIAFAGLRHGHIFGLYNAAKQTEGIEVIAACEEDRAARERIVSEGKIDITHDSIDSMLSEVDCSVVAVGDYYGKRGEIIIKALSQGKHVIGDKPLCTSLEELDKIEELSKTKDLKVGCMLDLRDLAQFIGLRNLVREGKIGGVHAVGFGGQHPLLIGTRPGWYFEQGKHGGTINDIAVHAMDIIPWITGLKFSAVNAARCWNAVAVDYPHFKDGAQMMLTMDNGCGVLGDVSYFAPDTMGYTLPYYWRMTLWGDKGVLETSVTVDNISLSLNGEKVPQNILLPEANAGGYLRSFVNDIEGISDKDDLTTRSILDVARTTLKIQKAADEGLSNIQLA